ncbi:(2Fe-2S)-binding protein, partial [candidate division WOR-3 bacterium]|nr:(2Fe-2S)-binding protein [candidate division WOR-3 bacterium]
MKKLIIDGIETEPNPKKTVLEVAMELGIYIPTLCYHKSLTPYGACRICIVETIWKGKSRFHTACTYPAWEGEVRTNSEPVRRIRKNILELMLAEAPDAPEIQKLAKEYGVERTRFKKRDKENKKCILCGLCVRFCSDIIKVGAIGFKNRGAQREITLPFEEFSEVCRICGACESVCPTNAIEASTITGTEPILIPSEFDMGLIGRPPIYTPFPQAVPNIPVIDT